MTHATGFLHENNGHVIWKSTQGTTFLEKPFAIKRKAKGDFLQFSLQVVSLGHILEKWEKLFGLLRVPNFHQLSVSLLANTLHISCDSCF